jgi:hypothetical protein
MAPIASGLQRSQPIMRVPVDYVDALLVRHDGARCDVVMFVPPDEDIVRVLTAPEPFLPMACAGKILLVARTSIAALGVPTIPRIQRDDDLPLERQAAVVHLRSGQTVEGELRWIAAVGAKRTADFLNTDETYVEVHGQDITYCVVKSHIAYVEER